MNEFILIFRNVPLEVKPTPNQLKNISEPWIEWMNSLIAKGVLVSRGNRLDFTGAVVKPGKLVTDGPYAEVKEIVAGYSVIKADTLAEATELAKGCPVLNMGGSVEVRCIVQLDI